MIKVLRTFYKFVFKKRLIAVVFLVLIIISPLAGAVLPYFYKLFIDAITSSNYEKVLTILFLYMGIRVLSLILGMLSYVLGDVLTFDAGIDARSSVVRHIQDLDFKFHASKSTGSLISAIRRGDGAFFSLHHAIHYRITEVIVSFFVMIYFLQSVDWRITLYSIISLVVALIATKYVIAQNVKTRNIFNEKEDEVSGVIVDNMINYETVKLFAKENWERKRLANTFGDWKKALWGYANSFRLLDISMGTIINVSIFIILYFVLNTTKQNTFSIGDFVMVVGFVSSFYPRLFDLVFGFRDIAKNYSDIKKYFEILDYDIEVKDPIEERMLQSVNGEVEFKDVSFSYKEGKARAVKKINLKIKPGESVALVGRSGVGKTTLVRLLMRFFDVDLGEITIDKINIKNFSKSRLRSFMGVVPQEPILFNNTIGYNISYGLDNAAYDEIKIASKMANLDKFIDDLPKKYETHVGERGIKLSGGQKQRLAIARMILSNPEIVIFDEATSQLDSESEKLIQDAFWKAVKNKTTIIIAHRLSTVMKADKIVVMEKGRISEVGTHRELLTNKDSLYSHFWNLQTRKA